MLGAFHKPTDFTVLLCAFDLIELDGEDLGLKCSQHLSNVL